MEKAKGKWAALGGEFQRDERKCLEEGRGDNERGRTREVDLWSSATSD